MAVPKKRTSTSKKHIRKNIWKRKGYWVVLKVFLPEIQKVFLYAKQK